jgi:hypothetical protein
MDASIGSAGKGNSGFFKKNISFSFLSREERGVFATRQMAPGEQVISFTFQVSK